MMKKLICLVIASLAMLLSSTSVEARRLTVVNQVEGLNMGESRNKSKKILAKHIKSGKFDKCKIGVNSPTTCEKKHEKYLLKVMFVYERGSLMMAVVSKKPYDKELAIPIYLNEIKNLYKMAGEAEPDVINSEVKGKTSKEKARNVYSGKSNINCKWRFNSKSRIGVELNSDGETVVKYRNRVIFTKAWRR